MSICSSNVTSGFIDLATFDEIEKYLYGGCEATAYFVRETRKSTWFTQVPVQLTKSSGSTTNMFGGEPSFTISRAGDYLLQTWLRAELAPVQLKTKTVKLTGVKEPAELGIRWTRNFMHNLVADCCITFNDLVAAKFNNTHLDFWTAFTVPASKQHGYNNMIGNVNALINPVRQGEILGGPSNDGSHKGTNVTLNLPLPFFFSRDSGVALPTAALPYNEMKIQFKFRGWQELLVMENVNAESGKTADVDPRLHVDVNNLAAEPQLTNVNCWANYAIVSNDERKRMACAPRDILMEQVQITSKMTFDPSSNPTPQYDVRFSHAIKVLFFAVRNTTWPSEWSNYTVASPLGGHDLHKFAGPYALDPIAHTSLVYENTQRLARMGSDYFSLVNPYYHAPCIPKVTGYHMYSYSLDFICLDPMGSTNYGKLTNVSVCPGASVAAQHASKQDAPLLRDGTNNGVNYKQTYEFVMTAVNNNIIRVSGGALGFPVL